jgi:serine protease Do
MINRKKTIFFAMTFIIVGLIIGLGISVRFHLTTNSFSEDTVPSISREAIDILSKTNQAMAEVVAAVKPSVVNISSTKTVKIHGFGFPFDDPFFKRFFGDEFGFFDKPREYKQSGLGSGVIVSKDGYILTNNHVVKDAEEILVKLSDKREFKGKIIGTDPKTDLAVIKIDADRLPVIKLGDSDKLKVGETVIAIGNPYGLSQTVTSGIVSAKGRANVGIADYEDFIQTDAPINPGNSGGALVNIKGELIGINTAIFSTSGGYQGIGFAIPTNMAKAVMESLIKEGKVIRGWLGVVIQPVTKDIAKYFKLKNEKGALVADVVQDSPAEKAGIQRGDVIIEYNGKEVDDPDHLKNMVASTLPDTKVEITIIRDGKQKTVNVKIDELPADIQKISGTFDNVLNGVHVQNITSDVRRRLNIPPRITGVLVTDIEIESYAWGILKRNDVIMEINKKRIKDMDDYKSAASKIKSDEGVLLLVYRNGSTIYVTLSKR